MTNPNYDVLVACETSGEIRSRLRAMGINAVSCDILPADDGSEHHIVGDAAELVNRPWGMVIAHPPCTYLANSGVRWLHTQEGRWEKMIAGANFFLQMYNANAPLVAVENPVMHKHARELIARHGPSYPDFTMQPYEHGDPATKRTCWWLRGLPVIEPTHICSAEEIAEAKENGYFDQIHKATPGPDRWKKRSKTFAGLANAVATVWGSYYLEHRDAAAA